MGKILITGETGYLGSRVVHFMNYKKIKWHSLGIRLEEIKPDSLDYDVVIHCAGALRNNKEDLYRVNHIGTEKLINGLRKISKIIFVSTRGVYSKNNSNPVDEFEPVEPWDDYGRTKLSAENLIINSKHNSIIFRCSALFGHPTRSCSFPDDAFIKAIKPEPIILAIPDRFVDYLYVDSLAELLVSASQEGDHWKESALFNVAGEVRSLADMINAITQVIFNQYKFIPTIVKKEIPVADSALLKTIKCKNQFPHFFQPSDLKIFQRMMESYC
jgi:nucleoside-diphosphate-sugar epimerase